jgi:UDP-glucose 4-epimerase
MMNDQMRVLVTGAAGLYGIHLVELLVKSEQISKVIGIDNFSRPFIIDDPFKIVESDELKKKFELIRMDFRSLDTKMLNNFDLDAVIHLAAYVSIPESMENSNEYFQNNEIGTFTLVHNVFKTVNQPHFIYASSPEVYGNPIMTPINVDHPLYPRSVYAATKLAAEKHCHALYQWHKYPVTIFRNFNTFGENQNHATDYAAVIPTFITRALKNETLFVHNTGEQTRDFMYVKDAVRAYLLAVLNRDNAVGQIFNLGTGQQTKIADLAKMIKRLTNSDSQIVFTKGRAADLQSLAADITKTQEVLNWEPQYSLDQGLQKAIDWYRGHLV